MLIFVNLLKQEIKVKIANTVKKLVQLFLNINIRAHIGLTDFEKLNWLPVNDRLEQCISSMTFEYFSNTSSFYTDDLFKSAGQHNIITRTSLRKLNELLRKTFHIEVIIFLI